MFFKGLALRGLVWALLKVRGRPLPYPALDLEVDDPDIDHAPSGDPGRCQGCTSGSVTLIFLPASNNA